jgi:hypothetical protein
VILSVHWGDDHSIRNLVAADKMMANRRDFAGFNVREISPMPNVGHAAPTDYASDGDHIFACSELTQRVDSGRSVWGFDHSLQR